MNHVKKRLNWNKCDETWSSWFLCVDTLLMFQLQPADLISTLSWTYLSSLKWKCKGRGFVAAGGCSIWGTVDVVWREAVVLWQKVSACDSSVEGETGGETAVKSMKCFIIEMKVSDGGRSARAGITGCLLGFCSTEGKLKQRATGAADTSTFPVSPSLCTYSYVCAVNSRWRVFPGNFGENKRSFRLLNMKIKKKRALKKWTDGDSVKQQRGNSESAQSHCSRDEWTFVHEGARWKKKKWEIWKLLKEEKYMVAS